MKWFLPKFYVNLLALNYLFKDCTLTFISFLKYLILKLCVYVCVRESLTSIQDTLCVLLIPV